MKGVKVVAGKYFDSITLMLLSQRIAEIPGVSEASISLGTAFHQRILEEAGYNCRSLSPNPEDFLLAMDVEGDDWAFFEQRALELLDRPPKSSKDLSEKEHLYSNLPSAIEAQPDANVVLISIPGRYVFTRAMEALGSGLNVMIFSDNVTIEEELTLKKSAHEQGLLVMGPDCGTSIVRGVGLGFANHCVTAPVGIVAASGTGLQEVQVQLTRKGSGILHGIGTGGRDLQKAIGGITFLDAFDAMMEDEEIQVIGLIGKPPAKEVWEQIQSRIIEARKSSMPKEVVVCLIGAELNVEAIDYHACADFEETASVIDALLKKQPSVREVRQELHRRRKDLKDRAQKLGKRRGWLRGYFTGGTLCYEAQLKGLPVLGEIRSNAPVDKCMILEDPLYPIGHAMIDYGDDTFTQGKLHPMMDPSLRSKMLLHQGQSPDVGVILFDLVLGYGCHPNPAESLSDAIRKTKEMRGDDLHIIGSICGVEEDPQVLSKQKDQLESAGAIIAASNAEAALLAAYCVEVEKL